MTRTWRWLFLIILLAYAAYAAVFIAQTVFVAQGQPYSALFDDAMISMTYARNLAQGWAGVEPGRARRGLHQPALGGASWPASTCCPSRRIGSAWPSRSAGALFFIASLVFLKKIAEELSPRAPGRCPAGRAAGRVLLPAEQLVAAGQ